MNDIIRAKIKTKNLFFKQYVENERFESDFGFLKALKTQFNELISSENSVLWKPCNEIEISSVTS